jgi:hypothetical protein
MYKKFKGAECMNRQYPLSAYNFHVFIKNQELGFNKISNIKSQVEYEVIKEGGYEYVHTLPIAPTQMNTLVFEKGCGMFDALQFPFKVGEKIIEPIHIFILGEKDISGYAKPQKHYCILGASIMKWSLGPLDSFAKQVLLETFEMIYERLEEIPVN